VGGSQNEHHRTEGRRLQELAAALGVADRFRVVGFLDAGELASVLGRCTLGLAPFLHATGSGSVSRLIAAGLPVVTSDLPPLRVLREEGAGVVLSPAGEVSGLGQTVRDLLGRPARHAELREQSARFAREHSFPRLARELAELLRSATLRACPQGADRVAPAV
jgi:glycosyltransferase involved in cell wall biosynthesis